ncbi:hypothetical protein F511_09088 [Dorcoceras hygrometricum]|nr:hypothetical protein F511_09088 [Dorcoceras hygrometricum]
MASSLIRNTVHVLFDSVLAMDDEWIVAIFEALVASGLKGFLGCPAVIYEAALIEFFQHGSVRDGMVVSTIQGKTVEITEEVFAGTFEFPIDGLTDLNEKEQDLELGDFKAFPPLKILAEKNVNRYIAINDKISVEDVEGVADESRVKKTPMKKAVCKKRPATAVDEHISKKKSTRVGKDAKSSAIVTVAQEAIPLQIVEPIRDDSVPARADVVDKEISTADDVDHIIEQVIVETAQFETDVGGTNVGETNIGDQAVQRADEMEHWFNVSYKEFVAREADRMVESGSDTDEDIVTDKLEEQMYGETNIGDQAVQRADEMEHWFNVSYKEFVAREADRMVESGSDTDEDIVTDKVTEIDAGETADGEQMVQRSDEKEKVAESGASEERVVAKKNAEFLCNKTTDEELICEGNSDVDQRATQSDSGISSAIGMYFRSK